MPRREPKRRPPPRLAGVYEVAEHLGISRSALADRRKRHDFPQPLTELMCGPIWDLDEIHAYANQRANNPHTAYRRSNQPRRQRPHNTGETDPGGRTYSICPERGCRQLTFGGLCDHHLRQARRRHQPR